MTTQEAAIRALWALVDRVVHERATALDEGRLRKVPRVFVQSVVSNYSSDSGGTGYQTEFRQELENDFEYGALYEVAQSLVNSAEFQATQQALSEVYHEPPANFARILESFMYALLRDEPPLARERVGAHIATLTGVLNESPALWTLTAQLEGIGLSRAFSAGRMTIRPAEAKDFERRRPLDAIIADLPLRDFAHPSAVLTLSHRAVQPGDVQQEFHAVLDALRLFRRCSVRPLTYSIRSDRSFDNSGGQFGSTPFASAHYRVSLMETEFAALEQFLPRTLPFLRLHGELSAPTDAPDPLSIGLQRYRDALLQPARSEARLTSAITCLEAVALKGPERAELSHRLGQRVAFLASHFGYRAVEAYEEITEAYDIRSTYIHGSPLPRDRVERAGKLCESVVEYARLNLTCLILLHTKLAKEQFINKIDNALLDDHAAEKASKLIRELDVPIPGRTSPPRG